MDPLHRGDLTVPVGHGRIAADVFGPKRFRAKLDSAAERPPASAARRT